LPSDTSTTASGGDETDRELIRSVAESTRETRLVDDFEYDPEQVNEMVELNEVSDPLLGHCYINSERLARRLFHNGYEPDIVIGALADEHSSITVESVEEAFRLVCFHVWVEIPPSETDTSQRIIVEIAAEPDGGVRVTEELPDNYTRPPESRITYDPTVVTQKQLRSVEGYRNLKSQGLVKQ
jgi:hypothetical protein